MTKVTPYGWGLSPSVYYGAINSTDYYKAIVKAVPYEDKVYLDQLYSDWLRKDRDQDYYIGKYVDIKV